jgi:hypothetical protein
MSRRSWSSSRDTVRERRAPPAPGSGAPIVWLTIAICSPSNAPSLWRTENRVERESNQKLVNLPVCASNPMTPVPVVRPLASSKTNSDSRNRPSWTIVCAHVPRETAGAPPPRG